MALGPTIAASLGARVGAPWLWRRRNHYRRIARPLTPAELSAMSSCFEAGLLDGACIAEVAAIDPPLPRAFLRGPLRGLDLRWAAGMAFIDTVVIVTGGRQRFTTLFHELVHLQQYSLLGPARFAAMYARGWWECGREYLSIPLEVDAYDLTERFVAGERPSVLAVIVRRFKERGW